VGFTSGLDFWTKENLLLLLEIEPQLLDRPASSPLTDCAVFIYSIVNDGLCPGEIEGVWSLTEVNDD
jgi:hypothetical protein